MAGLAKPEGGAASAARPRLGWADSAKGISIILVVMMHSALGVQEAFGAAGWLDPVVAFARPFRVPAFFLISGLFFAAALNRSVQQIIDRRVVPLAYVFVIWSVLLFLLKGGLFAIDSPGAALAWLALLPLEPLGALWFIHALILFSGAMMVLREAPGWFVVAIGVGLNLFTPDTGWTAVDEFANRFVFFAFGCRCAGLIAEVAGLGRQKPWLALPVIGLASLAVALFVWPLTFGLAPFGMKPFGIQLPVQTAAGVIELSLGFLGAAGLVLGCALIADSALGRGLGWLGRRTLPIYLAFTIPMATTRIILVKTGLVTDVGLVSLLVMLAAISGALLIEAVARRAGLGFLYALPNARTAGPAAAEEPAAGIRPLPK